MTNTLFCFGYGYVAQHFVDGLSTKGDWKFFGTSRSDKNLENIQILNFHDLAILPKSITHILVSVPPNDSGDIIVQQFAKQIKLLPNLEWVGYLSATSVYGDTKGEYVDENSPINPQNPFSKRRVIAEQQWKDLIQDVNIFRLSGIYGPGRSAIDRIKSGHLKILEKKGHVFSRIHVGDIVQSLILSIEKNTKGEIFNLADDYPCSSAEVMEFACDLLNVEKPKPISPEEADLGEMGKRFYSECRRISNAKIKNYLAVKLRYPSFKEGLKAQLKEAQS